MFHVGSSKIALGAPHTHTHIIIVQSVFLTGNSLISQILFLNFIIKKFFDLACVTKRAIILVEEKLINACCRTS